jgi:hypothetical protein
VATDPALNQAQKRGADLGVDSGHPLRALSITFVQLVHDPSIEEATIRAMNRPCLWTLGLVLLSALPAHAQAGGIAPLASHSVDTRLRTLRGLPLKRVITSSKGWRRVVEDLRGAPAPPNFSKGQVCLLIVADVSGKARTWVESIMRISPTKLRVSLARVDGGVDLNPHVRAFFFHLPAFQGGVELLHRTLLEGGMGAIQRKFPSHEGDRDRRRLPQLGPDMRLKYSLPLGVKLDGRIKLRHETYYTQKGLPSRLKTALFPATGLPFPRIRRGTGARHIFAAHTERLRSKNAMAILKVPPNGKDGSPSVVRHTFVLEQIPGKKSR